jgi:type II secretory pathway component PulF
VKTKKNRGDSMVKNQVAKMINMAVQLKEAISLDIEDVKNANHEKLLERNDFKLQLMQDINDAQNNLNQMLANDMANGVDVNIYRDDVDLLENHLRELYELNGKLASIVLPVREMYRQIIEEITAANGGSLIEVTA